MCCMDLKHRWEWWRTLYLKTNKIINLQLSCFKCEEINYLIVVISCVLSTNHSWVCGVQQEAVSECGVLRDCVSSGSITSPALLSPALSHSWSVSEGNLTRTSDGGWQGITASGLGYEVWLENWKIVSILNYPWEANLSLLSYYINHYTKTTTWEDPRDRYQQIGKAGQKTEKENVRPEHESGVMHQSVSMAPLANQQVASMRRELEAEQLTVNTRINYFSQQMMILGSYQQTKSK